MATLVLNRVWFLYSSLELGMLFRRSYFFIIIDKTINKSPSKIMFRARRGRGWDYLYGLSEVCAAQMGMVFELFMSEKGVDFEHIGMK